MGGRDVRYDWRADGDAGWKGLDMLHDPGVVQQGYLIKSENKRLRDGKASTRPGTSIPGDFNVAFENKIIGSGIFNNPNGEEVMLVATLDESYVWMFQFEKDPVQINLSGGELTGTDPNAFVNFVQGFEKILLLRFPVDTPLVWDGVAGTTFDPVTTAGPHTLIPNVSFGQPFQNRIILYAPYTPAVPWRDQFILTDVLDYAQYDKDLNTFRINAGESDIITCILPYFKGGCIAFMRDSVHLVSDFTVDPFATTQRLLNSRLGSVSVNLPFMDGSDIIFLSRTGAGFYRVAEIVQDSITSLPRPISWLIQSQVDRINWDEAARWSFSEGLGDNAYFSVPIDNVTGGCNAIFVYNTVTREFESVDTWDDPDFRLNALHVTLYNKERRLFGIDYTARRVYVLYDGIEDNINGQEIPVRDKMATRGYIMGDPVGNKRFHRANVAVSTYSPNATVSARTDGFNEIDMIGTIKKDRTRFYQFNHKDFDIVTDDPDERKRQDYSVTEDNNAVADFEDLPTGPLAFLPGTPLAFSGNKQETIEPFQIRTNGKWCSIEIENIVGQCDVSAVSVEASPIQDGFKVLA